jgi:chemotaxis protein methyltransferase CheR
MAGFLRAWERTPRLSDHDFLRLSRFIHGVCGIRLGEAKKTMLEARLQKRLRALGMEQFRDYCDYLFRTPAYGEEIIRMIDLVTTNKTDFFRESDHFRHLLVEVLPAWAQRGTDEGHRPFRVWSAGCSSGEEPYTLAMVLAEFAAGCPGFDFRILATDVSTQVLENARRAVYGEARTAAVPAALKKKYFLRSRDRGAGLVRIVPELRAKVEFRRLNFVADEFAVPEPFDAIFCRNVIIYFDRPTQERLLQRFCRHLLPDGQLFLGHTETLNGLNVPLRAVCPTVYRMA